MKKKELERTKNYFGSISRMAKQINLNRKTVSNWFNNLDIKIPYHYIIDIACKTKCNINVCNLGPEYKKVNNNFIIFVYDNQIIFSLKNL